MKKILLFSTSLALLVFFSSVSVSGQSKRLKVLRGGNVEFAEEVMLIDSILVYEVQPQEAGTVKSSLPVGKLTFLTYNLGADQSMTVSQQIAYKHKNDKDATVYGDLYQWGRKTDGHEKRTSAEGEAAFSSSDDAGHNKFVTVWEMPYDWRIPQNMALWDLPKAANDPCPAGFRIPTIEELASILPPESGNTWTWTGNGYAVSPDYGVTNTLFFPAAGQRQCIAFSDAIVQCSERGYYWTSTPSDIFSKILAIGENDYFNVSGHSMHASGHSVRCIKEY